MRTIHVLAALAIAPCMRATAQASRHDHSAKQSASAARLANSLRAITKDVEPARQLSGAILIARGNDVLLQQGYGFADWESHVPVSPTTRFGIGSISKPMTEIIVNALASEGRLELDAPVDRYLTGFPRGPRGGRPTIRDLLTHKAGVPHRVTSALDETRPMHPADIVERVRAAGLLFEPGTQELYSSAAYTCLARVVELVEGRPFADVIASRIFEPAGMTSATEETGAQLMSWRAMPYHLGTHDGRVVVENEPYQNLSFLTGAGSTYASAADMLHLVRAMRTGKLGAAGQRVWLGDTTKAWHSWYGRTNGYEASVDYRPSDEVTVVFLSNLRSAANWQIRDQIKRVLDDSAPQTIGVAPPIEPPFEPRSLVVGEYGPPEDMLPIDTMDDKMLRDGDEVYPTTDGWYYILVSGARMRFHRDSSGAVDSLITQFPGRRTSRPRMREK